MTKDEALNIAIDYMNERLKEHDAKFQRHPVAEAERNNILADIEAVKEALAQPEQEPVQWGVDWGRAGETPCVSIIKRTPNGGIEVVAVEYGPPAQRKPLTRQQCLHLDVHPLMTIEQVVRVVEAAHGIKGEA